MSSPVRWPLWFAALLIALALAVCAHVMSWSPTPFFRSQRESVERRKAHVLRAMDMQKKLHAGIPFDEWPESAKMQYKTSSARQRNWEWPRRTTGQISSR
jgi:hypothetical protein